jgi:hypothetical protein
VASDEAALHALPAPPLQEGEGPAPRTRPATLPPTADADLRLIRVQVDQQAQLLAAIHQVMVTGTQVVETKLTAFHEALEAQTQQLAHLTAMLEAVHKHLGL